MRKPLTTGQRSHRIEHDEPEARCKHPCLPAIRQQPAQSCKQAAPEQKAERARRDHQRENPRRMVMLHAHVQQRLHDSIDGPNAYRHSQSMIEIHLLGLGRLHRSFLQRFLRPAPTADYRASPANAESRPWPSTTFSSVRTLATPAKPAANLTLRRQPPAAAAKNSAELRTCLTAAQILPANRQRVASETSPLPAAFFLPLAPPQRRITILPLQFPVNRSEHRISLGHNRWMKHFSYCKAQRLANKFNPVAT